MNDDDTYPAPALARGICILDALNEADGAMTLDQLARVLGYPKASLLRLLETLSLLNLVQRDEAGKRYTALAGLRRHDSLAFVRSVVHKEMQRLTTTTGITSEWYEAGDTCMELVDLIDPPEAKVTINARIGFHRRIDDESEAVTRIALACPLFDHTGLGLWQYDTEGEKVALSADECSQQIAETRAAGITMDLNWNRNGIRRYATVLMDGDAMIGVLGLAETFTPGANKRIDANLERLKQSAAAITEKTKLKI